MSNVFLPLPLIQPVVYYSGPESKVYHLSDECAGLSGCYDKPYPGVLTPEGFRGIGLFSKPLPLRLCKLCAKMADAEIEPDHVYGREYAFEAPDCPGVMCVARVFVTHWDSDDEG